MTHACKDGKTDRWAWIHRDFWLKAERPINIMKKWTEINHIGHDSRKKIQRKSTLTISNPKFLAKGITQNPPPELLRTAGVTPPLHSTRWLPLECSKWSICMVLFFFNLSSILIDKLKGFLKLLMYKIRSLYPI